MSIGVTLRSGRVVGSPKSVEAYAENWAYAEGLMERCCDMLERAVAGFYISQRVTFPNSYLRQIQTALVYAPRVLNYLRIYCAPSIRYGDENVEKMTRLLYRWLRSVEELRTIVMAIVENPKLSRYFPEVKYLDNFKAIQNRLIKQLHKIMPDWRDIDARTPMGDLEGIAMFLREMWH
jgi:hypothetical protein